MMVHNPMPAQSIIITRKGGYVDRMRAYTIRVDGKTCGKISANSRLEIPVDAGEHTVSAHIDWCCSPAIEITVNVGETPILTVSNKNGPLLALFAIVFRNRKYLALKHAT